MSFEYAGINEDPNEEDMYVEDFADFTPFEDIAGNGNIVSKGLFHLQVLFALFALIVSIDWGVGMGILAASVCFLNYSYSQFRRQESKPDFTSKWAIYFWHFWRFLTCLICWYYVYIHFKGADPKYESYPDTCKPWKPWFSPHDNENCVRLGKNPYRITNGDNQTITQPLYKTSAESLYQASIKYFDSKFHFPIVEADDEKLFGWATRYSFVWGYPNDFLFQVTCDGYMSTFNVQSQSRVGYSDYGVNWVLIDDFLSYVESNLVPDGYPCDRPPERSTTTTYVGTSTFT